MRVLHTCLRMCVLHKFLRMFVLHKFFRMCAFTQVCALVRVYKSFCANVFFYEYLRLCVCVCVRVFTVFAHVCFIHVFEHVSFAHMFAHLRFTQILRMCVLHKFFRSCVLQGSHWIRILLQVLIGSGKLTQVNFPDPVRTVWDAYPMKAFCKFVPRSIPHHIIWNPIIISIIIPTGRCWVTANAPPVTANASL